jgi:AIPR protein
MTLCRWKGYNMSDVERQWLDDYLVSQKVKTDPDLPDDQFFEKFCAAQILKQRDLDIDELNAGITRGKHDGGADSVYFFCAAKLVNDGMRPEQFLEYEEQFSMHLILIQATRTPSFGVDIVRNFEDSSNDLLDLRKDVDAEPQRYNAEIRAALRRFRHWWQTLRTKLPTLRITFYCASRGDDEHQNVRTRADQLEQRVQRLYPCECKVIFVTAKMLLEMAKRSRREPLHLKFVKHLSSDHLGNAWVCLVPIPDYITFLSDESGESREYILEPNVRGYLGQRNEVNSKISETLIQPDKSEEFWWLNNGVTILAQDVDFGISDMMLTNPKIVNGLQTSREIYNYSRKNASKIKREGRHILVRVIEVTNKQIARHITKTTNSQSKIDPIYLMSTDDIHENIEMAFPKFDLVYERVKNQYFDDPDGVLRKKIITLPYLMRALIAIYLQQPNQARARPGQFAEKEYNKIFRDNTKPAFYANAALLMKKVEEFVGAHLFDKNDQNNLKFYVAMYATCAAVKSGHVQRSQIAAMNIAKVTDALLQKCLSCIQPLYDGLITDEVEADQVAKGSQLVELVKKQAMCDFPPKYLPKPKTKKARA